MYNIKNKNNIAKKRAQFNSPGKDCFSNAKSWCWKRNPKPKKEEIIVDMDYSSDENFAFIVGFTSGGAPFGITHEEMVEIENDKIDSVE